MTHQQPARNASRDAMTETPSARPGHGDSVNASSSSPDFRRVTMVKAQTDEAWWSQRAPFIGASTTAVLFGEHPFITLGQLARERRTGERQPDNPAMMRGRFLEDGVARWWAHVHGVEVHEVDELFVCNEVMIATLDRVVADQPVVVEVKTTSTRVHDVERYWWWQAQAQLACTGYERVEFAVLDGSMTLQSFTVEPDAAAMANAVDAAGLFLERVADGELFVNDTQPAAPDAWELDAHARSLVHAWRMAQRQADLLSVDIQRLKGMVDRALGAHDSGTINGAEVVRRMYRKGARLIDATRLRADHPDIAEEYTRIGNASSSVALR
jgi:putative phage-type endonuclease